MATTKSQRRLVAKKLKEVHKAKARYAHAAGTGNTASLRRAWVELSTARKSYTRLMRAIAAGAGGGVAADISAASKRSY